MYIISENNNESITVMDEGFAVYNALLFILSDRKHHGTITIIEEDNREEKRRHSFKHYNMGIEYVSSSDSKELNEDEIFDLFHRDIKLYIIDGDENTKADYTFVVDIKNN